MTWSRLVSLTALCSLSASCAASSLAPNGPFQALAASPLFALQDSADPSLVLAQYERFLLSKQRSTPLLLYFTPANTCYEAEDEEEEPPEAPSMGREACIARKELVEASVELAAERLSTPELPVVRVDVQTWPSMLHYHLMSSTPSLLWVPGRASGRFQRYPHVETNFLDLSANGSLFTSLFGGDNDGFQQNEVITGAVAKEITAFVRLCQERSGYLTRNSRGKLLPAVPIDPGNDALSGLELIPVLAFVAFVAFVVNENREFVLGVVRTRLFWFVLCLGVIYVALSGLFHSIIHRRAWYYFGRMHGFVFVYPSSRRQFVLEGLINGTWSFWLSLGAMSIAEVAPALKSRLAKEEVIRWSLLLVVVSYMALYLTFLMKYRWLA
ncbi:hypothetical protein DVH05_004349 [Phytophthora capsici]|nr:hypothetical protein DVH05_004349 [Phytophthora capsici]